MCRVEPMSHLCRLASIMSPTLSVSSASSETSRSTSPIHCSSTPRLPYLRESHGMTGQGGRIMRSISRCENAQKA